MGKRSDFARIERDHYPTPLPAVLPLSGFLDDVDGFAEVCVGNARLAEHLQGLGHACRFACDLSPGLEAQHLYAARTQDVMTVDELDLIDCSHIITNPPWPQPRQRGEPTLSIIHHLAGLRPTWLLLSADFKHNDYAAEVMSYCLAVVSVGRVKWIEDSEHDGKDNAAWYLFDRRSPSRGVTLFHARAPRTATFAPDLEALIGPPTSRPRLTRELKDLI
jgi:hypothetical protein